MTFGGANRGKCFDDDGVQIDCDTDIPLIIYDTESCLETITWFKCTREEEGDWGFEELFGNDRDKYWSTNPECLDSDGEEVDETADFFDQYCFYLARMYSEDPERYVLFADVECEGGIGPLDVYDSDMSEAESAVDETFSFTITDYISDESDTDFDDQWEVLVQAGQSFAITFSQADEFGWTTDTTCSYMWYDESDSSNDQRLDLYFTDYYECLGNDLLTATGYVSVFYESSDDLWYGLQTFTVNDNADTDDEMRLIFTFDEVDEEEESDGGEEEEEEAVVSAEYYVNVKIEEASD